MSKCSEPGIARFLPWYLNGTLSKTERDLVEGHIGQCPSCANDLLQMKWLAKQFMAVDKQHVDPEQLVIFAEARHELRAEDLLSIEHHLESCADCKHELQILRKSNRCSESTSDTYKLEPSKQKWSFGARDFLTRPALAYIVILLLL